VAGNFSKFGLALLIFLVPEVSIRAESAPCHPVTYEHSGYTVCEVDLRRHFIKLFWKKPDGHPYEYLSSLPRALGNHARRLLFATNGGSITQTTDKLRCKNALFLDGGSATSFYSPVLGRNGNFLPLGPIIGVYGAD